VTLALSCERDNDTAASGAQQRINWLEVEVADKVQFAKKLSSHEKTGEGNGRLHGRVLYS
jgi:hypothetical protein